MIVIDASCRDHAAEKRDPDTKKSSCSVFSRRCFHCQIPIAFYAVVTDFIAF